MHCKDASTRSILYKNFKRDKNFKYWLNASKPTLPHWIAANEIQSRITFYVDFVSVHFEKEMIQSPVDDSVAVLDPSMIRRLLKSILRYNVMTE